jgi:hemoglobin
VTNSFFEQIGGTATFERLVASFYRGIADDPLLRPMYPADDMAGAEERLRMFLEQYWGGPKTYQEKRGHPRLRMRHAEFKIDPAARDAWLKHMRQAVNELELAPLYESELWGYLERAAHSMLNSF